MITPAASNETGGIPNAPRRKWAIASVLAGIVLVVLDAAIANIALPVIAASLRVAPASAVGVITAYQLGLVMMLLPAAALGESLGYRRVFVAGAAVFTAASAGCALSPSLAWLMAARFAQGLGGAGIMSLGIALLRFIVPSHRLGAAIGWNALTVALSSAAGPTLGAMILSFGPWPWLFAVNLPIGACVLIAARALPCTPRTGHTFDVKTAAISAVTFASFVLGAECMQSSPATALALFAAAALMTALLVRRESGRMDPQLPLDLLRQSSLRVSAAASVLCFAGQAAALVALPFHLQHGFGLSPFVTALYLLPWPLAVAATGPLAGILADRMETALLCLVGGVILAIGLGLTAFVAIQGQPFAIGACMALCGVGFSLFNVSNNRSIFMSAPRERSAAAGGLQGIARLTGQTLGAVAMTVLFAVYPIGDAPRIGLALATVLTLSAGVASGFRVSGWIWLLRVPPISR